MLRLIRRLYEKWLIKSIVSWCIDVGTTRTLYGTYIIDYEDIAYEYGVTIEWIKENHDQLVDEFNSRDELLEGVLDELDAYGNAEGFNMNFCGIAVCKKCSCYKNHEYCDGCNIYHDESWGANA